jgi:CII-binding regulator of phage lambda lysogenization HflD
MVELEEENKLQQVDILHISELVAYSIILRDSIETEDIINSRESILTSLSEMLETMLTSDIKLSRERKLNVIHLLTKLKANKEYLELVKEHIQEQQQSLSDVGAASSRMFRKSQSAFGND